MPRDSRVNVPLTDPVDIADHRRRHRPAGRYDSHEWLGYDDGGLAEVPFGELVERIADLMADERPDVVGTFGPQPGHSLTAHQKPLTLRTYRSAAARTSSSVTVSVYEGRSVLMLRQNAPEPRSSAVTRAMRRSTEPTRVYRAPAPPHADGWTTCG
jgi:LmbE family N-acetylglucosaminyl deacetylase